METSSQGSRRSAGRRPSPRPDSSASVSSHATRMTPASSNSTTTGGSTLNLPQQMGVGSRKVSSSGGASLLQERLRERKVEKDREKRRGSVDGAFGNGYEDGEGGRRGSLREGARDSSSLSSPVKSSVSGGMGERRPSSSGPKGMGVKQIEEHVSTLTKQNFNLKLELHHRRERQTALEAKLEAAEKQLEEQEELQEINEQLLAELEKRDQAVEEAVGIIVSLEDRVEKLMQEREVVRNFDPKYETSDYFGQHNEPSSSPPTFNESRSNISKAMVRMPSFLSEQSEGAEALRSLYLPNNQTYRESDVTLPKLLEEASDSLSSPRLSALSVSSFMSIYGNKQLALDDHAAQDEEEEPQRRHRKSESVEKWIDERPASVAPVTIRNDIRKNQYLSINDVMESPLQRLEKLQLTLEKHNNSTMSTRLRRDRTTSTKDLKKPRDALRRVFTDKTSFDHQQGLPPTPDTISSSTLRHFQANSNDTLSQDANNHAHAHPKTHIHNPTPPRPRSACETITSRREGHGWDTETATTETDDLSSVNSFSYLPPPPPRVRTPNLFTFHDFDRDSHDAEYGFGSGYGAPAANMMFTHPTTPRYANLRRNSVTDFASPNSHTAPHPSSDATVTPTNRRYITNPLNNNDSSSSSSSAYLYGTSPIDISPRPDPPDRRSSLSAAVKVRRARELSSQPAPASSSNICQNQTQNQNQNHSQNQNQNTTAPQLQSTKQDQPKKSRLATRFFSRADSAPPATTTSSSMANPNPSRNGKEEEAENPSRAHASATPPPIRRSRGAPSLGYSQSQQGAQQGVQQQAQSHLPRYRPSSAGTMPSSSSSSFSGAQNQSQSQNQNHQNQNQNQISKQQRRGSTFGYTSFGASHGNNHGSDGVEEGVLERGVDRRDREKKGAERRGSLGMNFGNGGDVEDPKSASSATGGANGGGNGGGGGGGGSRKWLGFGRSGSLKLK